MWRRGVLTLLGLVAAIVTDAGLSRAEFVRFLKP
jgi:hypothetical protein